MHLIFIQFRLLHCSGSVIGKTKAAAGIFGKHF